VHLWILPNGERISMEDGEDVLAQSNATGTLSFRDKIVFTKHVLEIPSIQVGMDGRYSCVFDDGESKRSFFIPYVISHIGFSQSALLSLSISGIFCLLCLLVLFADCYFSSHRTAAVEDSAMEPITAKRKGHIQPVEMLDSTSFSSVNMELEDLPPIFLPHAYTGK